MAEEKPKYISINEFVELGYLQEVNRQFFHPLGLALAVRKLQSEMFIHGVIDNRDDLEGMILAFNEATLEEKRIKAAYIANELEKRTKPRTDAIGSMVQKIPT